MDEETVLLCDYPAEGEFRASHHVYRFFAADGCKLRVGAYTSLNTLCTYLESDVSAEGQAERNFWVSFLVPAGFWHDGWRPEWHACFELLGL